MWKVHSKDDMIVGVMPKSNFPISLEFTFGAREGTPARCEKSSGAWFGVEDAALLVDELEKAIEQVVHANDDKYWFWGRTIKITDMKNGRFVWETDRDESGYVTSVNLSGAINKINAGIIRLFDLRAEEEDKIAESLAPENQ